LEADALLYLSESYATLKQDYQQALRYAQQASEISRKANNPALEVRSLQRLAQIYRQQGQLVMAVKTANEAVQISRDLKNSNLEWQVLDTLAEAYSAQGKRQEALETQQRKLQISRTPAEESLALNQLSLTYLATGDTQKALETAQDALNRAKQSGQPLAEIPALSAIGSAYWARGEFDQAIEVGQRLLKESQARESYVGIQSGTLLLASVYDALGDYNKVVQIVPADLAAARKRHNALDEAGSSIYLGNAYIFQGNFTKAKELLERALQITRQEKNLGWQANALNALGQLYKALGQYSQAMDFAQQGSKIAKELNIPKINNTPEYTLADIYYELGDYSKSREFHQQILSTARQLQNRWAEGGALLNLALLDFAQGQPQQTVEKSQQALELFKKFQVPRLMPWANSILSLGYADLGNDQKAMEAAQNALTFAQKVQNPGWEKQYLNVIGHIHRKFGRREQAIAAFQQALSIPVDQQVPGADYGIYWGLGSVYRDLGQPIVATVYYKQAVNGLESLRHGIKGLPRELQSAFLKATTNFDRKTTADTYRELADLLISQGRLPEAQEVLELLKIQEINDVTSITRSSSKPAGKVGLTPTEEAIQNKYTNLIAFGYKVQTCKPTDCEALKAQLKQLRGDFSKYLETIQSQIDAKSQERFDQRNNDFIADAGKIVNSQPNTVLIYPLVVADKVHVLWASSGGGEKAVLSSSICAMKEAVLNAKLEKLQDMIRSRSNEDEIKQAGKELYDCLIRPVEEKGDFQVNKIHNLIIVPDLTLNYIPFAALYDGTQYLVQKYAISNALSATKTKVTQRLPSNPSVLGFGVSEAYDTFPALPGVEAELQQIIKPIGLYQGSLFLNEQVTASSLETRIEQGSPIVHIATHGEFNSTRPLESYLLLSSGTPGKGNRYPISQIRTIEGLSQVHLIVLSACQTGTVSITSTGQEMQGINSFFIDGDTRAQSVMASLWNVDDTSTSLLMREFYKNLAKGMTKTDALRQAQLRLLKKELTGKDAPNPRANARPLVAGQPVPGDFSHPYYWAPFILTGNPW